VASLGVAQTLRVDPSSVERIAADDLRGHVGVSPLKPVADRAVNHPVNDQPLKVFGSLFHPLPCSPRGFVCHSVWTSPALSAQFFPSPGSEPI
jgi:hypothetical protein